MPAFPPPNGVILISLLTLVGATIGILGLGSWIRTPRLSAWVALTTLIAAPVLMLIVIISGQGGTLQNMLVGDGQTALWAIYFCSIGGIATLIGLGQMAATPPDREAGSQHAGTYALILLAVSGALVVAQAVHMLSLLIGLAITYVALLALLGVRAARAGFVVQCVGLACILFGAALLYGATGTLYFPAIVERLYGGGTNWMVSLAGGLLVAGTLVAAGSSLIHLEESAVPPITQVWAILILTGVTVAAWNHLPTVWRGEYAVPLAVLAGCLHLVGYGSALWARHANRALVGIGIAQAASVLLATAANAGEGTTFYLLFANSLSLVGIWAGTVGGVSRAQPWLAVPTTLCLLSLSGMPPLAGFLAQLHVLQTVASAGWGWAGGLLALGMIMAWIVAGRWLLSIWHTVPDEPSSQPASPEAILVALLASATLMLEGLYAEPLYNWITNLVTNG